MGKDMRNMIITLYSIFVAEIIIYFMLQTGIMNKHITSLLLLLFVFVGLYFGNNVDQSALATASRGAKVGLIIAAILIMVILIPIIIALFA
ncbi:hypothetical protein [Companilactobacillus mishanensis]|uniref:Uncharacterized protein n=1 Tax=Companilactobacillus mishanensis TaxID=2486008 RepID=A0A5P0ZIR9_9LACO|nr:hypothetical protein [Companilactobacillus mishanensis]MQS44791.1 hypothetical protein [Companilactobacillus mishanensis]MQS52905.1 hypothetical protein [Companilactobacillus mishanensis]